MDDGLNLVPDDDEQSTKPDLVVTLEEPKEAGEPKKDEPVKTEVRSAKPVSAAAESVEALARNLAESKKRADAAEQRLREERAARAEAETRAKSAESNTRSEQQKNIDANRTAATNAIAAAKAERAQAKQDWIALTQDGKFDEAFEAAQRATQAENQMRHAEGYLANLEKTVAELEKPQTKSQEQPKPQLQDDEEGRVDKTTGVKYTPMTADWIDKHKDNWADEDFRIECDAASRAAKRQKLQPDTPEYFEFIEKRLQASGYLEASEEPMEEEAVQEEQPKPAPVVKPAVRKPAGASAGASPTRAVPGTQGVRKQEVRLSGAEREVAEALVASMPDEFKGENPDTLYARNKKALIDEQGENYGRNQS